MIKSLKSFFLLFLLMGYFSSVQAQMFYYVNGSTGNDSNDGLSETTAWKTIQKSFNQAIPGSTVTIHGGIYREQLILNVSGTPGNPILFTAAPGDMVAIDGTGLTENCMISIIDQSHVCLQNLIIRNLLQNFGMGILVEASPTGSVTDVSFKKLTITGINWTNDFNIIPQPGNNTNPFLFYGTGLETGNAITNIVVDSCEIYNNITGYSENLTLNGNVDGAILSNNRIHNNTNIGIDIAGTYGACSTALLDHARNVQIVGNSCYYNISRAATSAGIYVDGGRKVLIERNSSYHNGVGIEIGCENDGIVDSCIIRDNIVFDNLDWGIGVGGYDPNTTGQVLYTTISNNTLYKNNSGSSDIGEFYMPKASHCSFTNNIVYASANNVFLTFDPIDPQTDNRFDYNCWYASSNNPLAATVNWRGQTLQSFQAYRDATGFDQHSFYANPLLRFESILTPDFHLRDNSPCINAGDSAFVLPYNETDFFSQPRLSGNRVDIGACEYQENNGTGELPAGQEIYLYPNPAQNKFFICHSLPYFAVEVFNLQGKLVKKFVPSGDGYHTEGIQKGFYLVKLSLDNKRAVISRLIII